MKIGGSLCNNRLENSNVINKKASLIYKKAFKNWRARQAGVKNFFGEEIFADR